MHAWQVQDAKARFSELLRSAAAEGPQAITVRGRTTAVVMSQDEYERLKGRKPSLVEFLRTSPLSGVDLDVERDRSLSRDIEL
ncbi:Prevent-host-death family protein [Magnetospirillum sp. LM-5]|uniref:type II toxin-antitoxin system Phd/YefM family antitoxin n=1 Tax=Magnetospirillum sp. LM-5 TaxID=2681466 RepID=UPI0013836E3A|nr:type II toxin-antitoxin system Phd/YefM family antitoxin [Magnetospirillum sp. LM-5]CAA7621004.1 Prevent-host-death family protein [Magnetospirillum sp. LM-5]